MAPKKLTEADKTSILKLYRKPEETTSTLADRFGVSNSTISRLLKAKLPEQEYGQLIQQKRSTADKSPATSSGIKDSKAKAAPAKDKSKKKPSRRVEATSAEEASTAETSVPILKNQEEAAESAAQVAADTPPTEKSSTPVKRTRRRSQKADSSDQATGQLSLPTDDESTEDNTVADQPQPAPKEPPKLKADRTATEPEAKEAPKLKADRTAPADDEDDDLPEDIPTDWDDNVATLDDDYDDDDDDDDFEEDGENWESDDVDSAPHLDKLEITPLATASLPRLCYVVVERSTSELVALPLRTFAHLGDIPETEGESRTLPVFDIHRVARRFSRRNQRVVKLPDGELLQTTSPYLQAKCITRLLIDGQVFALEGSNGHEETAAVE